MHSKLAYKTLVQYHTPKVPLSEPPDLACAEVKPAYASGWLLFCSRPRFRKLEYHARAIKIRDVESFGGFSWGIEA